MRPLHKTLTGFAVAPLMGVLGGALYGPVLVEFNSTYMEAAIVYGAVLGAGIGYALAALIGVPAYFILKSMELLGLGFFAVTGAIIGFAAAELGNRIFQVFPSSQEGNIGIMLITDAVFALTGALASCVFWFIARPDREG
jgi:hypothetical protein